MSDHKIEEIHESLVNGQKKQMVQQIEEYGLYDFWEEYRNYLEDFCDTEIAYMYFSDVAISYHRIKN